MPEHQIDMTSEADARAARDEALRLISVWRGTAFSPGNPELYSAEITRSVNAWGRVPEQGDEG